MYLFHKHLHSVTNPAEDFHTSQGCTHSLVCGELNKSAHRAAQAWGTNHLSNPPAKISVTPSSSSSSAEQVLLTIHEVQNEAELVRGVEGIGHTDYKRTVLQGKSNEVHLGQKAKCDFRKAKSNIWCFFLCYLPGFPNPLFTPEMQLHLVTTVPPMRALPRCQWRCLAPPAAFPTEDWRNANTPGRKLGFWSVIMFRKQQQ